MMRRLTGSQQSTSPSFSTGFKKPRTRRHFLLLLGSGLAALTSAAIALSSSQKSSSQPTSESQQSEFLALSVLVTARPNPHPLTSSRIYKALSTQHPQFQESVSALMQLVRTQQLTNVDALMNVLNKKAALTQLKTVLHDIISAWYLGEVQDKVIAFESALMFDPVRNVVGVPSYCWAPPGYWAMQPTKA